MTMDHCRSIPFEALVVFLREKRTIADTRACLQRIHWLAARRDSNNKSAEEEAEGAAAAASSSEEVEGGGPPATVNVRVFLAGFMIAARPSHVFEAPGAPLESALLDASRALTLQFERICGAVLHAPTRSFATVPHATTEGFGACMVAYMACFKAWKVPDETKLATRIRHALIALYQAEALLPPDEPHDSALKREFVTQIERLRSKLQQLTGPDGLRQFDIDRATPAGRVALTMSDPSTAASVGPYATTATTMVPDARTTNEQLAHELLLNPLFQLEHSDAHGGRTHPVMQRIHEGFHRAYWDSIADDLRLPTGECFIRVLRVVREVRDGLVDLAAIGSRELASVQAAIDLPFLEQQMYHGAFGWDDRIALVGNVVAVLMRLQSPHRDAETRVAWQTMRAAMRAAAVDAEARVIALCNALQFLMERVHSMRIDAANARLRLMVPVINDHGIEYERGKFQDKLNDGSLTLDRTRACVHYVLRRELLHHDADGALAAALRNGDGGAHVRIHTVMLLHLVSGDPPTPAPSSFSSTAAAAATAAVVAPARLLPETLQLDADGLNRLFLEFRGQALAIRLLLLSELALFQHNNQPRPPVLVRLQARLGVLLLDAEAGYEGVHDGEALLRRLRLEASAVYATTTTDSSNSSITRAVESFIRQASDCITTVPAAAGGSGSGADDAVTHFIHMRLASVWRFLLFHQGRFPTRELAPELNIVHGPAAILEPRIRFHAARLTRLMTINREVHTAHYNALVFEALPPAAGAV